MPKVMVVSDRIIKQIVDDKLWNLHTFCNRRDHPRSHGIDVDLLPAIRVVPGRPVTVIGKYLQGCDPSPFEALIGITAIANVFVSTVMARIRETCCVNDNLAVITRRENLRRINVLNGRAVLGPPIPGVAPRATLPRHRASALSHRAGGAAATLKCIMSSMKGSTTVGTAQVEDDRVDRTQQAAGAEWHRGTQLVELGEFEGRPHEKSPARQFSRLPPRKGYLS
jgi:hypothetical protein